jgi:hypothetical protein
MTDKNADNDSTEMTDNDSTPTANGVELDSVVGVANALTYLDDPYNVGDIAVRSSEDLVIIQSRGAHFGHMYSLLEAQNRDTSASSQSPLRLIATVIHVSESKLSEVTNRTTTTHRPSKVLS